jgi:hypothetical protein
VIYEAGGNIYRATVKGGHNDSLGSGSAPDYSLDGLSMVWVRDDHVIFRHHGHNRTFGSGNHPLVSDRSGPAGWAIGYDSGNSVKLAIVRNNGRTHERVIVENGVIGGVTAYAAQRGIVVFATGSSLFYLNRHTGNTDDLAHAYSAITEPSASARSNLVAFSASGGRDFVDTPSHPRQSVYVKYLPK